MNSPFRFPRRVRIHGGECGAVARALHHEAQEDALISYELSFLSQADFGKSLKSTSYERKLMSTKTSIKRIALVAVSALGFGLLSMVPAKAAVVVPSTTIASATSSTTVGTKVTNTVTGTFIDDNAAADNYTVTASLTSAPATATLADVTGLVFDGTSVANAVGSVGNSTAAGKVFTVTSTGAGRATSTATLEFTPNVAGTYVISLTSSYSASAVLTWTVTAVAKAAVSSAFSTSVLTAGLGAFGDDTDGVSAPRGLAVPAATAAITLKNASTSTLVVGDVTALSASISGPGLLKWAGDATVGRAVTASAASLTPTLEIWADGTAGVATVTITMGTTPIATETVTFFGAVASVATTVVNSVIGTTLSGSAANVGAITAVAKDANGVPVAGVNLYATSDALTVVSNSYTAGAAVTDATGKTAFTLTALAAGTANITVGTGSSAAATTNITAAPVAVRVGSRTVASVTMSFDKASYLPGELATITVTALDANGNPVVNSGLAADVAPAVTQYTLFTGAITSSMAMASGTLPGATVNIGGTTATRSTGKATFAVNMPITSGTVTLKGTSAVDGLTAVTATATVAADTTAIDAAADAAAEAIDAANAATDAANLAAEAADAATVAAEEARDAADAATAAVEELATQVATLMAALKAQITTLANTVAKIAKKVRA
jgi:hypothetical protein